MDALQYNWSTDVYYKLLNHNYSIATGGGRIIVPVQIPVQLPYATTSSNVFRTTFGQGVIG